MKDLSPQALTEPPPKPEYSSDLSAAVMESHPSPAQEKLGGEQPLSGPPVCPAFTPCMQALG